MAGYMRATIAASEGGRGRGRGRSPAQICSIWQTESMHVTRSFPRVLSVSHSHGWLSRRVRAEDREEIEYHARIKPEAYTAKFYAYDHTAQHPLFCAQLRRLDSRLSPVVPAHLPASRSHRAPSQVAPR
ncbi:hypothetical protein FOMPIDRAFT_1054114 [Fomitopsis schrenkii]|uniref:Uncharacterized protein n=1 Tax=Fomitopsis schrenkii TaxID=2126942 RepID=S8DWD4_FOMSC|nr:hypothetical protein FOMPIDRAFT_1054114 [Fomitopsis schrenkii]